MKIPIKPPLLSELLNDIGQFSDLFSKGIKADQKGEYYHWDKLRHLPLPQNMTDHKQWWLMIKMARNSLYKNIAHNDKSGHKFVYAEPDAVRRLLHQIDKHGSGEIKTTEQVITNDTRETYLINSLIEEAITSSQLEGAATTRKVAKEMLRQNRKPQDKSETMIMNNYHAMEYVKDIQNEELTPQMIYHLHSVVCENTLDNKEVEGRLRKQDDVYIGDDRDASILHVPPKANELEARIQSICDFANSNDKEEFLHPVLRAIILHFLLAYDHPFEDGNGRTARALFYWSMLKQGYWLIEFISISRILKVAPAKYTRAYLYTETDDNDVTYFLMHQLNVIHTAIEDLLLYLKKKSNELKRVGQLVRKGPKMQSLFNYRQTALLNRALKTPHQIFYIESHRGAHNITYDTARTDLLKLTNLGLLEKTKQSKAFVFSVSSNLKQKLMNL